MWGRLLFSIRSWRWETTRASIKRAVFNEVQSAETYQAAHQIFFGRNSRKTSTFHLYLCGICVVLLKPGGGNEQVIARLRSTHLVF